ncbi:MAG: hypothetical protein ACLP7A_05410 [Desulfobaccales bacterium]
MAKLPRFTEPAFSVGKRVAGDFGGKVECSSYLIGPYRDREVRVVIPG